MTERLTHLNRGSFQVFQEVLDTHLRYSVQWEGLITYSVQIAELDSMSRVQISNLNQSVQKSICFDPIK